MKVDIPKDWSVRMAELEGDSEIGAGRLAADPSFSITTAVAVRPRFDGAAVWDTLSYAEQQEFGRAALELCAARYGAEVAEDIAEEVVFGQAEWGVTEHLDELAAAILYGALGDEPPGLPTLLGAVCRRCGCSEHAACFPPCGWAEPNLCTSCADTEVRPRTYKTAFGEPPIVNYGGTS